MRLQAHRAAACAAIVTFGFGAAAASAQTDAQIRQRIIRQSIASYGGSCPCPYSVDRGGRRCGGRSAYSRPGGDAPICYARDVSAAAVRARR